MRLTTPRRLVSSTCGEDLIAYLGADWQRWPKAFLDRIVLPDLRGAGGWRGDCHSRPRDLGFSQDRRSLVVQWRGTSDAVLARRDAGAAIAFGVTGGHLLSRMHKQVKAGTQGNAEGPGSDEREGAKVKENADPHRRDVAAQGRRQRLFCERRVGLWPLFPGVGEHARHLAERIRDARRIGDRGRTPPCEPAPSALSPPLTERGDCKISIGYLRPLRWTEKLFLRTGSISRSLSQYFSCPFVCCQLSENWPRLYTDISKLYSLVPRA